MLIRDLSTTGALPALEMMMRFSGQRQQILAHNIANIDTPNFQAKDVDPESFQSMLRGAIETRRERTGGAFGALGWRETREVTRDRASGEMRLEPGTHRGGVLHHDRNDADLERTMQDLVENAAMYRVAADLLRAQRTTLQNAIAQRVA